MGSQGGLEDHLQIWVLLPLGCQRSPQPLPQILCSYSVSRNSDSTLGLTYGGQHRGSTHFITRHGHG